jgi:hypothetical protein
MEAKDMVMRAYARNDSWFKRTCTCCASEDSKEELKTMYILGRYPAVSEADTPSDVIWENLGYTTNSRKIRCTINWVLVVILLIVSVAGTIMIMD